jgi:hypothetical protein
MRSKTLYITPPTACLLLAIGRENHRRRELVFWRRERGYLPLGYSLLESAVLKAFRLTHYNDRIAVEQLPHARPPDFSPRFPRIDLILRTAIEEIMIRGEDTASARNGAAEKADELLGYEEQV